MRNPTCDCGKVTKERGNSVVTRSKLYETRSGRPKRNGGRIIVDRKGCRNGSLKTVDRVNLNNIDKTIVDVVPVNNKSFDLRNSTINISKASTNIPHDNMVVTNGNARRSSTDAADENINVGDDDETEGECVECKCIRSNKKCDESSKLCKKHFPQVVDGESEKELREDKQNGDYEGRDNDDHCATRSNHTSISPKTNSNGSNRLENGVEENGDEILANGLTNGGENGGNHEDIVCMDVECGKVVDVRSEDADMNMCGDRKKRKSRFEEIFDECAEFSTLSDKRRSRRPPESYSPEPSRRLKLEQLFEEKISSVISPSIRNRNRTNRPKPIRKYKPKGPIFHYLDLYIKNKDLGSVVDKAKESNEEQLTVKVVEEESSLQPEESSKSPLPLSEDNENGTVPEHERTLDEDSLSCIDSAPSDLHLEIDVKTSSQFSDCTNNGLLLTTTNKLINNRCGKVKPKPLALDAEIQSILGYRCDRGRNEFLVLFHNGTSNWVVQDHNVSISTAYEDFYQYSEHDLSTINRLSYFISEYSNRVDPTPMYPPSYSTRIPLPYENSAPSPTNSTCSSINSKSHETTVNALDTPEKTTDKDLCTTSPKDSAVINGETELDSKVPVCGDDNTKSKIKSNTCFGGTNETLNHRDLNDLCYYVFSSRHIKLYPFETTKEVVFKRDDEFMHIYLRNTHKNQDSVRRIDDQINMRSCERLIYKLEDCAVDDTCQVVVISGIEEYFALKEVFDKLLKKPSSSEGTMYEQDVSMLRYLIQTIRNFAKPICAVIKKTAVGLPASMLSLFDMVFDERCEKVKKKKVGRPPLPPQPHSEEKRKVGRPPLTEEKKKLGRPPSQSHKKKKESSKQDGDTTRGPDDNNGTSDTTYQAYLFPRLMGGLTESNESRIMGECRKLLNPEDLFSTAAYSTKRTFSAQLRKSLRNMKNNTKVPPAVARKSSRSDGDLEEIKDLEEDEEDNQCTRSKQTAESIQTNLDNLTKEIEREKELTKKSMAELQSILLAMEPP